MSFASSAALLEAEGRSSSAAILERSDQRFAPGFFDNSRSFCYDIKNISFPENLIPGFWNPGFSSKKRGKRMRGDQLARQWRVIRAIEASPNGLTAAEIAVCDGHMAPYEKPLKSLFQELEWAFLF